MEGMIEILVAAVKTRKNLTRQKKSIINKSRLCMMHHPWSISNRVLNILLHFLGAKGFH
jgi:hypothetical protein